MKWIRLISRILTGIVFLFSGFVKAIDPLGTTYKFTDYFEAFRIPFLNDLALPFAILQNVLELLIGINLIIGLRMKITGWVLFIFMTFYLILTFILAIWNPVTDCGCFGDALILTNWQTFYKNVILYVPTLIVFLQRGRFKPAYKCTTEWGLIAFYALVGVWFSVYNYRNLPILDFRPYKIGTYLPEKMTRPEGAPVDEYEFTFIYTKNGENKEFTLENMPDSTWKWVETKQKLLKKGYVPPIHDFSITSADGTDITQDVLSDTEFSLLVVANHLEKSDPNSFVKINELAGKLKDKGIHFYLLTASTSQEIEEFQKKFNPGYGIYITDDVTLKTMIRSNPGLILLKEGVVLGMWHYRNIPQFSDNLLAFLVEQLRKSKSKNSVYLIVTSFLLVIFIFHSVTQSVCKQNNNFKS